MKIQIENLKSLMMGDELNVYQRADAFIEFNKLVKHVESMSKQVPIRGDISRLSMQEVLNYEIHSHRLTGWIGFEWGQDLMGKYFAWKIRRKYTRYSVSLEERKRVLNCP